MLNGSTTVHSPETIVEINDIDPLANKEILDISSEPLPDGTVLYDATVNHGRGGPFIDYKYKVKFSGISPYLHAGNIRKFVEENLLKDFTVTENSTDNDLIQLPIRVNCRKAPKSSDAFVGFKTEKERSLAISNLQGKMCMGRELTLSIVSVEDDIENFESKKRSRQGISDEKNKKSLAMNESERLQDQITPLWRHPYPKQLILKYRKAKNLLEKFNKQRSFLPFSGIMNINTELNAARPCNQLQSVRFPHGLNENQIDELDEKLPYSKAVPITGYRNKCEFAVGYNESGNITVGFSIGNFRDVSEFLVISPSSSLHISETMKALVKHLEDSVIHQSGLLPYNRRNHAGFWRLIMVREFSSGDCMVCVQIQDVDISENALTAVKSHLIESCQNFSYLRSEDVADVATIKSLQIQSTSARSFAIDPRIPFEILYGPSVLVEKIENCIFEVSALSFFQVNLVGTTVLYQTIKELALGKLSNDVLMPSKTTSNITLLDLCCGNGTIGIYMSSYVRRVIGIEIIPEAITNAIKNSQLNNVDNATWIVGKLEDTLGSSVNSKLAINPNEEIVVVLDPPRAGIHGDVIRSIRACSAIRRIVFVSCHPEAALQNLIDFCRPTSKRYQGVPFNLSIAVPVDMFPFTEHYELVVLLVRT